MSNVLSDEKRQQILALGRLGWTLRQIEQAIGVRRETASNYLKAAGIEVYPPGRRGERRSATRASKSAVKMTTERGAAKPAINNEVTTDFCWGKRAKSTESTEAAPSKPAISSKPAINTEATTDHETATSLESRPKQTISACEPYRELIERDLELGRNAMAIWQDLVSQYGFERSYQSVKRFVQKIRPSQVREARPVILTAPGEEAQVDYGKGPMVRDPHSGKYRRTRLFVMTLGYSRKS